MFLIFFNINLYLTIIAFSNNQTKGYYLLNYQYHILKNQYPIIQRDN